MGCWGAPCVLLQENVLLKPWLYGGCWSHYRPHKHIYIHRGVSVIHCRWKTWWILDWWPFTVLPTSTWHISHVCVCATIMHLCVNLSLNMLKVAMRALWLIFCTLAFIFQLSSVRSKHILLNKTYLKKNMHKSISCYLYVCGVALMSVGFKIKC